jgi:hypothetical protein
MKPIYQFFTSTLLALLLAVNLISPAWAFGGFYVGGANGQIHNRTAQVIIARQGENTVLTMANDFQGNVKDFALVVPLPVAIQRGQVSVADQAILQKLDIFTQPRLVEYTDISPCINGNPNQIDRRHISVQGVRIENNFQAGEYSISVLSANDSEGLETWLRGAGYQLPRGASEVLRPYIRQQMKFLVAKVNLAEFNKNGGTLRPLQISYKSPKFMLPIRLGMLNSQGEQDLLIYLLSPRGRIEVVNYRNVEMPTNQEVPEFAKHDFRKFYNDTFQHSYEQAHKKVVFLEYAWNANHCDPCTTTPLNGEELRKAGVFWQGNGQTFITRLHLRYNRDRFPEDLVFQETSNQGLFQSRYNLHQTYRQEVRCGTEHRERYQRIIRDRQRRQADNAVRLTGRRRREIEAQMVLNSNRTPRNTPSRGRRDVKPVSNPTQNLTPESGNQPSQDRSNTSPASNPRRSQAPQPNSNRNPVRDNKPAAETESDSNRIRNPEPAAETDRGRKPETESDSNRGRNPEPAAETDRGRKPETESDSNRGRNPEPAAETDRGHKPETESDSNRGRGR